MKLFTKLEHRSRPFWIVAGLSFLALVGMADYLAGFEIFFSVFYLLGVGLVTWFVGRNFGLLLSVLSVMVWIIGDLAAGARFSTPLIPIWNASFLLGFYFIVVWLLTRLRSLHVDLEAKVRERTMALTQEMYERTRLEQELSEISEREQRRIGHDLHDSLGQHLTGTALAGQVLAEKLDNKQLPEAAAASHLVELVEEAIDLTRKLARGLSPVEGETEGLMDGLRELADNTTERFKIRCLFACNQTVLFRNPTTTIHLYRIAQESTTNAIKHGKATAIIIRLDRSKDYIFLTISDNGSGLPAVRTEAQGMGLRIMAYRARMLGAIFNISAMATGGTCVTCQLPINDVTICSDDGVQK